MSAAERWLVVVAIGFDFAALFALDGDPINRAAVAIAIGIAIAALLVLSILQTLRAGDAVDARRDFYCSRVRSVGDRTGRICGAVVSWGRVVWYRGRPVCQGCFREMRFLEQAAGAEKGDQA